MPRFYLRFSRTLCSSAVGTLSATKEWPTLPTLCLITAARRTTALGLNSSWMQLLTRSVTGHDLKYSHALQSFSQSGWAWMESQCISAFLSEVSCHYVTCSESSQLNTLFVTYSVNSHSSDFFPLQRLTTKHLKGTHTTDSWAETIWQKLVSQFQVRPTTRSTRTSRLGQQAFTATAVIVQPKAILRKMH